MFFKINENIAKEKELIARELVIFKKEKLAEIMLEVAETQERGAKEEREYECGWHNRREKLETELAVLEAGKKYYVSLLEERNKNYVSEYNAVIKAKDETISILKDSLKSLISKTPTETINTIIQK